MPGLDTSTSTVRLSVTIALNFLITIIEIIGGLVSGSLSLLSDALHNFSDGIAIIISYIAIRLSRQPKSPKYTFGLKRAEIIAAVINAGTLAAICFYLFIESYRRFTSPHRVAGGMMITVASIGLIANLVGTLLLKKGSGHSINVRAAYLHLMGDTVSSAAVITGGICIYFFQVYWLDPLLTVLISLYILKKSIEIIKETIDVLMMGAPRSISLENIQKEIEAIPGVENIHHVHVWRLDERDIYFEAHIEVKDMPVSGTTRLSNLIEKKLKHNHGIGHTTLQFESDKCETRKLI